MKSLIKQVINTFGWDVVRFSSAAPITLTGQEPTDKEIKDLEDGLRRMERVAPGSFAANRDYIGPGRLTSYKFVIKATADLGIDLNGKKVLDIGTCLGFMPYMIKQRFPAADVSGWDHVENYIAQARELHPDIHYETQDIEDQTDKRYDVIYCTQVLEHMLRPDLAVQRMSQLLTPGGSLILTVPDGRTDNLDAKEIYPDKRSYEGHINFWSLESWEIFLKLALPEYQIKCFPLHDVIAAQVMAPK